MASTYLTDNFSSISDSKRNFTISLWFKCSSHDRADDENIYLNYYDSSNRFGIGIDGNDRLKIENMAGGAYTMRLITNRLFRDTNAWYHLVCRAETNASAQEDRFKIFINGVQETSFSTATYIPQNNPINMPNSDYSTTIGAWSGGTQSWNGSMSHFNICDGYSYDASAFGEFDANGVWKIKTSPSVTYGTNGFFILKDGNSVTDQSGNGNNFTVAGGTLTNTEDSPSNVFATFNALYNSNQNLSNGNLSATNSTSTWNTRATTIGASSGKYYAEYKINSPGGASSFHMHGVYDLEYVYTPYHAGSGVPSGVSCNVAYYSANGEKYISGVNTSYGNSYDDGDILNIALDLDNGYVYFGINGTWQNSGDPTSGASGTGGIALPTTGTYGFAESVRSTNSTNTKVDANFGNGYFGTTAVASAGTNASGIGIFEHDVPTGFTALSTKGLNL